ncbi:hypothetical protein LXA43DRAFT_1065566 [Ganoderma leucocontextum]|nr:hypothetical protein LXA43DRAFT_1065566 [Ganoderma leucocontextum]
MPQQRQGLFHLQGLVWLPAHHMLLQLLYLASFWLVVTSRALSSSSMFSDQFCLAHEALFSPSFHSLPLQAAMTRSYNTRSAGKRKRSQSNSSAEDVDQSPPEAVKKSSKKKTKSKQRKSKHSNLESEADFSLGSEAEAEAEKRGRAKGGKKKSKAPKNPPKTKASSERRTEEDLIAAQKRGDKIYHDGISSTCLKTYWKDVQWLSSQLRPYVPTRDIRHDADRGIIDTYVIRNGDSMERIGVHHLVHAWPQQGHENGPLNVSADMVHGSIAAAAVRKYFQATRPVAIFLAQLFKHAFPEHYEEYCAAFDAGVWYTEDPGPWIGRAIVYELDV